MFARKALLAAVILGVTATQAYAEEGLGIGTQFAGNVISTSFDPTSTSDGIDDPHWVSGDCNFEGVTRGNGIQFSFGGHAVANSRDTQQPQYTELACTITSVRGPSDPIPDQSMTVRLGFGLAASAVAGETPVWPLRSVKICIEGFSIFGPVDPVRVDIPPSCKTHALLP